MTLLFLLLQSGDLHFNPDDDAEGVVTAVDDDDDDDDDDDTPRGKCENDPAFRYKGEPDKDCESWVPLRDDNCRKSQEIDGKQTGKQVKFYCPQQCKSKCAPKRPCDGPYYSSSYAPNEDSVGPYDCQLAYFDNLESLEEYCNFVWCDKSKKCPELGFTTLSDRTIFPPNPFGFTCGESYIKPNKPVPPCCETGSWVTCNYERCESERTRDVVCPGMDDNDYCDGFTDCFSDLCDCDEARNGICKWAN